MAMNYDLSNEVINGLCDLVENDLDALKHACGDSLLYMDNDNWAKVMEYIEKMQTEINETNGELKSVLNELKVISSEVEQVKDRR